MQGVNHDLSSKCDETIVTHLLKNFMLGTRCRVDDTHRTHPRPWHVWSGAAESHKQGQKRLWGIKRPHRVWGVRGSFEQVWRSQLRPAMHEPRIGPGEERVWSGVGAQATPCGRNTVPRDGEVTEGDMLGEVAETCHRPERSLHFTPKGKARTQAWHVRAGWAAMGVINFQPQSVSETLKCENCAY